MKDDLLLFLYSFSFILQRLLLQTLVSLRERPHYPGRVWLPQVVPERPCHHEEGRIQVNSSKN